MRLLLLLALLLPLCGPGRAAAVARGARPKAGAVGGDENATGWSGPEVRVVRQPNGAVAWQIDGHQNVQPQFFKVALTHDPHAKDNWSDVDYELQLACKAAVPVVSFYINEANVSKYGNTEAGSSWSLFSRSFDPSTEAMFARVETICPDAYLWPNIDAWLPPKSCGATPLDNVTLRVSTTGSHYVDYSNFNNAPNSAWLDCASGHLSRFMALLDGRFPGKIWGVQVSNLVTTEWFLPGSCTSGSACFELGDYANSTRDAYCASIGQTHWDDDGCEIPTPAERINGVAGSAGAGLLATSNSARFATFLATRTADAIAALARVTKVASNGKAFFATYYGYILELSGCRLPATGHFAVSRLLAEPAVDGIISPYMYEDSVRLPGGALLPHGVFDSPSLRNKLYIIEDDSRTALCFKRTTMNESIPDAWCLGYRQDSFFATRNLLLRNLVTTSLHFAGSYWYDMVADGWFGRRTHPVQSTQLWDMHAAVRNRFQDQFQISANQPAAFEIAILVDDMSAAYITPPGGPSAFPLNSTDTQRGSLSYFMHAQPMHSLVKIGAPFRTFLLSDILLPTFPAEQLKLVIITAALCVTDEIADAINHKLKSHGRTLLWLYAPGAVSADTGALDPMGPARLTGLPLSLGSGSIPLQAHEDATGDTLGGLSPGGSYNVTPWFGISPNNTAAAVVNTSTLANYSARRSWSAIVSQQFSSHTAIFSGVLNLPTRVLQRFAASAGAHRWTNGTDDVVESAGNLLMLIGGHSGNAQPRRVQLPATVVAVYDDSAMTLPTAVHVGRGLSSLLPGRLVCRNCSSFSTDHLLVGAVRLYWLEWNNATTTTTSHQPNLRETRLKADDLVSDEDSTLGSNLSYFSWYALGPLNHSSDLWGAPYVEAGPAGTLGTGANVLIGFDNGPGSFGTGMASLASISAAWEAHRVPSFFTPDKWFQCENKSAPLLPGWRQALAIQAQAMHSSGLIAKGAIKGIFYGDELGCCGLPFWAVDAGISYFRGALGEVDGIVHHVNACEMTLGCPPSGEVCDICPPGCGNSSSDWLPRYWAHVPASLDFVSVDVYCYYEGGLCSSPECPGGASDTCEVTTARHFYEQYVFPKLGSHQRVWLVPGLFAKIENASSYAESLAISVNETAQLAKLAAYAQWTSEEDRIVGWMPYHYSNRLWYPSPASGSWGAEVMPQALAFLRAHAPPAKLPPRSLKADDDATADVIASGPWQDLPVAQAPPCPCSPASLCRSLSPQPAARPEVLAFHTAGWVYPNPTTVNKTEPFYFDHYPWDSVTTVAPFVGQGSGADWGVDEYTPQLVCKAHQHNARVVGHIGHGAATWPAILSGSYRTTWVSQIVSWFIKTQGMDGIQFDIEALSANYTDAATSLACELKQALTLALPGSTLSWCSSNSPKDDPGGWDYNYTRLGSCVDYFVVMEYQHGLGPTWQDDFDQGLRDYNALGVRASQIVYALAFFGAEWACCNSLTSPPCSEPMHGGVTCTHACWYRNQPCNGVINGVGPFGYAGFARIEEVETHGNAVQYQPRLTPSPFVDIMVNNTGPPTNMSMRFRWEFDDPRSVRAKAVTMRAAKVGGVGMWTADALDYSNASRSGAMWRALLGQPMTEYN